jgi:type II secretory pathway component PulF
MKDKKLQSFLYCLVAQDGQRVKGALYAYDIQHARRLLQQNDKILLWVKQKRNLIDRQARCLAATTAIGLFYDLGQLLEAGISLVRALELLISAYPKVDLALVIVLLKQGQSLSSALVNARLLRPGIAISIVKGAETTGNYIKALIEARNYLQWKHDLKLHLIKSLTYPLFLMALSLSLLGFLFSFVMPKLTDLYQMTLQEIPWITQVFIEFSAQVPVILQGLGGIGAILGLSVSFILLMQERMPRLYASYCATVLKLPFLGSLIQDMGCIYFCKSLGKLLESGHQSVLASLDESIQNMHPKWLRIRMHNVTQQVRIGKGLSKALALTGLFPLTAVQLIMVAEETGQLPLNLERISVALEKKVHVKIESFAKKVGPAMVMAVGALLIMIVTSTFLPLYESLGALE